MIFNEGKNGLLYWTQKNTAGEHIGISALHPPHDKQGVEKAAGDGFLQMLDLIDGNVVFSGDGLQNLRAVAGDTALLGQPAGNLCAAASVFAFDGEIVAFHGEVVLSI